MKTAKIELVIFDCDGVLIDSEFISAEVLLGGFAAFGADLDLVYFYENCLGRSFAEVVRRLKQNTGISLPIDFEQNFRVKLLARFEQSLSAMPDVKVILETLSVPFCVATSSYRSRAESALQSAGLFTLVQDKLYTADVVQNSKPAPDLFLHAAQVHNVEPANCLVIEDSDIGLEAAIAAKMKVWRFIGGSHFQSPLFQPQKFSPPIFTFAKMRELPLHLQQHGYL